MTFIHLWQSSFIKFLVKKPYNINIITLYHKEPTPNLNLRTSTKQKAEASNGLRT